jgi:His-Xaa-Ser system protein HxsD
MKEPQIDTDKKENFCILKLNPKIYSLDVIYCAAYVFIDKAYVIIDGDPDKVIEVLLKPKQTYDLRKLGLEFYNELLNYSAYDKMNKQNKMIRDTLLQKALLSLDYGAVQEQVVKTAEDEIEKELQKIEKDIVADVKDIALPWEEKYGQKSNKSALKSSDKENDIHPSKEASSKKQARKGSRGFDFPIDDDLK